MDEHRNSPEIDEDQLDVARRVAGVLRAELPEETAEQHISMLRAHAARDNVRQLRPRRLRRRMVALAAAAALVLGGAGIGAASEGAMPGDVLYPVNRALEKVELVAARSAESRAETHLAHAASRLEEVDALREVGRFEHIPGLIRDASASVDAAYAIALDARGPDADTLRERVLSAISAHIERLSAVQERLIAAGAAEEALSAIDGAIRSGNDIAQDAVQRGLDRRPEQPGPPQEQPTEPPAEPGPPQGDRPGQAPESPPSGGQPPAGPADAPAQNSTQAPGHAPEQSPGGPNEPQTGPPSDGTPGEQQRTRR